VVAAEQAVSSSSARQWGSIVLGKAKRGRK
jgi:hypothetical protein